VPEDAITGSGGGRLRALWNATAARRSVPESATTHLPRSLSPWEWGSRSLCEIEALHCLAAGRSCRFDPCDLGSVPSVSVCLPSACRWIPDTIQRMKATTVRTYSPKPSDIHRRWHVIDATDVVLGRLASQVARLLRGKHKPIFAPHMDTGDFVIVVNAEKVVLTGKKREQKLAYRHSGYPGGLRSVRYSQLLEKHPERAVEKAVKGMLPHNRLGRQMFRKLKVYAGPDHPHQAQQPAPYEITQVQQPQ
jgi:large subunit ribosomal protein L13